MSSSLVNCPLTRTSTRSPRVSTEPAGTSVLAAHAVGDGLRHDAERREPLVREFDVDAFGLLAQHVDFLDHRHFQQTALDVFR